VTDRFAKTLSRSACIARFSLLTFRSLYRSSKCIQSFLSQCNALSIVKISLRSADDILELLYWQTDRPTDGSTLLILTNHPRRKVNNYFRLSMQWRSSWNRFAECETQIKSRLRILSHLQRPLSSIMSHGPPAYASAPEEGKTLYPQVPTDQPQQQPGGYYPPAQQPGSGQTAVTYYPPSGPQPQQQPQQLVVTQVPVVVSPQQPVKSYVAHIIFSCFVFWCCGWGCLCGLIAFILASKWYSHMTSGVSSRLLRQWEGPTGCGGEKIIYWGAQTETAVWRPDPATVVHYLAISEGWCKFFRGKPFWPS